MECPMAVKGLMRDLAGGWSERFDDEGPSVMVDSYECVGWDAEKGVIVYTPAMDPMIDHPDAWDVDDHFIITEDELRMMVNVSGAMIRVLGDDLIVILECEDGIKLFKLDEKL